MLEEAVEVPDLVRAIRATRGLTQEGLARELGVSFATVNGWENGRHQPIPLLARRLAEMAGSTSPESPPAATPAEHAESADVLAERSGWAFENRERKDFYHRVREFPEEVQRWRQKMVNRVAADPKMFPLAHSGQGDDKSVGRTAALRALIDDGISYLREIARTMAVLHGTPDLGNKSDPVDELVYIILSRKTREGAYQAAFDALKKLFPTWDQLLEAEEDEVESLLSSSGLGAKKTRSIFGALRAVRARFGSCTMEPARTWSDEELEAFLSSLPELHTKSAYCIMMYSFRRKVFPVDTHVGRVISRLGPYRELGLELRGMDHKRLQVVLADLVPPVLRYSLHVNLLQHGREVCRAVKPLCGECDVRRFCRDYREREHKRIELEERPRCIDLFSGAGGLSEGFFRGGFEISASLDLDPMALRTYWLNHPYMRDEQILCRDVADVARTDFARFLGRRRLDALIGAPPCQGFSTAGHRSKKTRTGYKVTDDERNYLFTHIVRLAVELRPRLFLMENVPGMKSAHDGTTSFLDAAARRLQRAGFQTTTWKLNAAAYGVAQERHRMFLVASNGCALPQLPRAQYQDFTARAHDTDALPPVTFDEGTFDLPPRGADEGAVVDLSRRRDDLADPRYRRYLVRYGLLSRSRLTFNHTVRYNNERDLKLYALLRPGEDSVHAVERHGATHLMRYRRDVFDDKYARLRADKPCKTIVAHLAKDGNGYIHPSQVRSISIREAARVQSFSDDYVFCGAPSDQWVQLGNAVPPLLAQAIAQSFIAALNGKSK